MGRFKNNTEKQLRELQNTFLKERAQKRGASNHIGVIRGQCVLNILNIITFNGLSFFL